MIFKSYLWYPDIYVWVSGVGGGGWLFLIQQAPPTTHPQNLSHIYDTLTFMFECQGWGGGGSIKMEKKIYRFKTECWAPPTFKSYLWYPDIYFWVLGVGSHHVYKLNFNKYIILIKIIFHFYFFQNKAVPSADM